MKMYPGVSVARPGPSRRCCVEKVWWPLASGAACGHQWCRHRGHGDQPTNQDAVSASSWPITAQCPRDQYQGWPVQAAATHWPSVQIQMWRLETHLQPQPPVISVMHAPSCKLQYAQHTMKYKVYRLQYRISLHYCWRKEYYYWEW